MTAQPTGTTPAEQERRRMRRFSWLVILVCAWWLSLVVTYGEGILR